MTELQEMQFEILPTEDALDGFVFGIGAEVSVGNNGFTPGTTEWLTQDSQNTRRGNVSFGRDVLTGPIWAWSSHVNREDEVEAVDTLERFSTAWRAYERFEESDVVVGLRYQLAGRTRRIYGRPRRFDAPPANEILSGYVPVTHDFQAATAQTYSDEEKGVQLALSQTSSEGGWNFPVVFPVTTLPSASSSQQQIAILGTARSYPVIRFNGPWTNPELQSDEWTLRLKTNILDGDWIEIDTRPWRLTVTRRGGLSAAGVLDRRTWLEDIYLKPQSRPSFRLFGNSASGGATCDIRWRDAWNSI